MTKRQRIREAGRKDDYSTKFDWSYHFDSKNGEKFNVEYSKDKRNKLKEESTKKKFRGTQKSAVLKLVVKNVYIAKTSHKEGQDDYTQASFFCIDNCTAW